ncbi:TOPRIM domain, Twinkle-like protein [Tanacetum coccineum]
MFSTKLAYSSESLSSVSIDFSRLKGNFQCGDALIWNVNGLLMYVLEDASPTKDEIKKDNILPKPSEENLRLEPIGDELIKYFAGRMIPAEILQKNAVMQKISDKAKNGEKILYGLDGIKEGKDIVIVEGELDKLSMEQAHPELYLDKAPRIIAATDGDKCGQALAEVLSYVLGRERCWRVIWPKKDESSCYKDSNEVLVHLGVEALRHVVETAEKYEILDDPTEDEVNKKPSEETLRLEPLGDKLIEYFAGRMISAEILEKNAVMQMIDDKESRFRYLLDCNGVKNASQIILAIHDDRPGPALAELSSVLGKERCWRVTWPMKDESSCYKDANEVLVHLGAEALRHVVETAELYEVQESV